MTLSITLRSYRFSCPRERCSCRIPKKQRQAMALNDTRVESCPFKRRLTFNDSFLMLGQSLDSIIQNMHESVNKSNVPIHQAFPASKAFADQKNLNMSQFKTIIEGKLSMPHEFVTSFDVLVQTTEPPPKEKFFSKLRNSHISSESYTYFCTMWRELGVTNLLQMYEYYNVLDTVLYADAFTWFYEKLFQMTKVKKNFFFFKKFKILK